MTAPKPSADLTDRFRIPTALPPGAEVAWELAEDGARAAVRLGEITIASFLYGGPGLPEHEVYFDAEGEPHGVERERRDGPTGPTVRWTAEWQHGEWHGDSYLLDPQGRPVSVARFEHGTGLDLWDDEVHPIVDGAQHGAVRWGDPCAPYEEEHYVGGLKHGPHRRWTEKGALEPDFPQFYVEDEPVDRAEYAAACAADPTLPPYKASDDSNRRTIPPALAEARARAAALADTFDLKAYLAAADAAWLALFR